MNKAKCVWFYTNLTIAMCITDAEVDALLVFVANLALSAVAIRTVPTKGIENLAE
jgi:hypothetical protein